MERRRKRGGTVGSLKRSPWAIVADHAIIYQSPLYY